MKAVELEICHGNSPCQVFAMYFPPGIISSPHVKWLFFQAAARCILPLGFGRQRFSGPRRVGFDVFEGDVYDRMVLGAVDAMNRDRADGATLRPASTPTIATNRSN